MASHDAIKSVSLPHGMLATIYSEPNRRGEVEKFGYVNTQLADKDGFINRGKNICFDISLSSVGSVTEIMI